MKRFKELLQLQLMRVGKFVSAARDRFSREKASLGEAKSFFSIHNSRKKQENVQSKKKKGKNTFSTSLQLPHRCVGAKKFGIVFFLKIDFFNG
jgi:hypothetical protein